MLTEILGQAVAAVVVVLITLGISALVQRASRGKRLPARVATLEGRADRTEDGVDVLLTFAVIQIDYNAASARCLRGDAMNGELDEADKAGRESRKEIMDYLKRRGRERPYLTETATKDGT